MFFELAEVLYVVQFTCSTNADYSDAVHTCSLQYAASPRVAQHAWQWSDGCQTGAQTPRRVFLRLVFANDASIRFGRVG